MHLISRRKFVMENLERVLIGLILFAVTSVLAYLFRMRQLYVAVPKLFRHAPISNTGSICELIVYNKGNQVEEDIVVELDPELKCELLASSSSNISFERSSLIIDRLHKGAEASAVLLVENGLLDATKIISTSSKATKGRVLKKASEIPPNFAFMFLLYVFLASIVPLMIFGKNTYDKIHNDYVEYKLKSTYQQGWKNLSKYYGSDLSESYSREEFPIRLIGREANKDKKIMLVFEVYNKTAITLEATTDKVGNAVRDTTNYSSVKLEPMSKSYLKVLEPETTDPSKPILLEFTLKSGEEFIYDLQLSIKTKQLPN